MVLVQEIARRFEEEIIVFLPSPMSFLCPEVNVKPLLEGITWNLILPRVDEELVKLFP